jgi:DNA-binding transcriptional MerR regulator
MMKIGDFARIGGVSVATLRHYDETGLLSPYRVDEATGYRFYRIGQLPRLYRILVLKDLGLTLREIEILLRGDLSSTDLHRLLAEKRAETERRLEEERERLLRIEARIALIDKENTMPELEVIVKTAPVLTVATRRLHVPTNEQVAALLDAAYAELWQWVGTRGVSSAGPCLGLWHSAPDAFTDEVVDAAIPLPVSLPSDDRVTVQEIPLTEVAAVVHHGPFEEFLVCHRVLTAWLAQNGYELVGAYREIYHQHEGGPATTEVQYPIARVVAG